MSGLQNIYIMSKAIMGKAKCLSYMVEVLNNWRFNRAQHATFEDVNHFIPSIVPLGYKFAPMNRGLENGHKAFLLFGPKCNQLVIYFTGSNDIIESFEKWPKDSIIK